MPERFEYTSEDVEKGKSYIKNNLGKHNSEEIPLFIGWTPRFELNNLGFKLEHRVDLLVIGKKVGWNDLISRVKGAKKPVETQVDMDDGKDEIRVTTKQEMEYGRQHAGSQKLFDENKEKINQVFEDLNKKNIDYVVFRTFWGWPAVWDSVEFYSKPTDK